ncbi:MAG: hypothetical protein HY816_17355 [Candidatus Wallbacteria bacterium]|nr:hypothetical protein [Candidatus Wallbacteria bacterium]
MMPFDFKQPGQFDVQVPWRLGPEATHCPLVVHAFFGYTWMLQEQIDLRVEGLTVEVNGKPVTADALGVPFAFPESERTVRKAGSGRQWWYRMFRLPLALFPVDRRSTVRVRIHRRGRAVRALVPVPKAYNTPPDMRIGAEDSPYAGEERGWHLFEVYRSSKPLPGFDGFYSGDTHVHTEYTHSSFEFGGPIEVYAAAAKTIGLDWATFTDHGHSFDSRENLDLYNRGSTFPPFEPRHASGLDAKWNEFVARTQAASRLPGRPFVGIVGTEVDVRAPSNQGHEYFCHALVYGHARPIPAEGPNGIDVKLGPVTVRHGEHGTSGKADVFGADTLTLAELLEGLRAGRFGNLYGADRTVVQLAHPINKYGQFKANPVHIGHWWRWGFDDEPNELPALYERASGRLPVTGFQVFNSNTIPYSEELDPAIPYWDSILCEGLRMQPPRRNTIAGGTDAHGDLGSVSMRSSEPGLGYLKLFRKPDGDGFGTVRTVAACEGGLSEARVLEALRDGRTFVTNGPALMIGVDKDSNQRWTPGVDVLPSVREGDELTVNGEGWLDIEWRSSEEFGAVEEVRLISGRSTGARVIWSERPAAGPAGFAGRARVRLEAGSLPAWSYLRAECVTRRGQDVLRGERLLRRVERRAYTNPIWVLKTGDTRPIF